MLNALPACLQTLGEHLPSACSAYDEHALHTLERLHREQAFTSLVIRRQSRKAPFGKDTLRTLADSEPAKSRRELRPVRIERGKP